MSEKSELVVHPAHDPGGLPPGGPLTRDEDLGGEIISTLGYYERWAVAASKVLTAKGLIISEELGERMALVRACGRPARDGPVRRRGARANRRPRHSPRACGPPSASADTSE